MEHTIKIRLCKKHENEGLLTTRHVTIREKLMSFLLGKPVKLTVLVPGDDVDEVAIIEKGEGGSET